MEYYFLEKLSEEEKNTIEKLDVINISDSTINITPKIMVNMAHKLIATAIDKIILDMIKKNIIENKNGDKARSLLISEAVTLILSSKCCQKYQTEMLDNIKDILEKLEYN